jgi:2-amino-4-hydroxy-6-hydroxymethyldihydropteridine diphosphokinase
MSGALATRAFIGLGSNLGDRLGNLADALTVLGGVTGVRIVAVSHAYESEPWGVAEQPAFANAVAALDVDIDAPGLLAACKRIEADLGREDGARFGPRIIDLDVLLFGGERIGTPSLTVPHPRLLERDFVVTPLLEVAPSVVLPGGEAPRRDRATEGRVTGLLGTVPGFAPLTAPAAK